MPTWSWFLIWGVLVVALVAVCFVLGRRAIRKLKSTLRAYDELSRVTDRLLGAVDELGAATATLEARRRAAFGDRDALAFDWALRRAEGARRRQARRDARIRRGRLLTHSTQNWTR